jgi:N-methylhydantoinase A
MDGRIRVGGDVGGTFTDIIFIDEHGTIGVRKVLSTPDDYSRAIVEGVAEHLAEQGQTPDVVTAIEHGTTVATNAILERRGGRVGLLTTKGFRDVLEIRRVRLPKLYDITWKKPEPLVPRHLRREVDERMGAFHRMVKPLDEDSARTAIEDLKAQGVEAVAICFLHSYADPAHERTVAEMARDTFEYVSVSSDVLPEMREYERTATTVLDAYVKPLVSRYLGNLELNLGKQGVTAPIRVMQSGGGLISAAASAERPVGIIESGPAAGVIAAAEAGRILGLSNLITFDMGGTTAKTSVIEDGEITLSAEYEVGGDLSQASRLIKGGGHLIRIPAINISEVGAGGGSLAWIDAGGIPRVGPRSAGADPGPVCYGLGGDQPTVTDANLVLGYLNPEALLGGDLPMDAAAAAKALDMHIATPLGLTRLEAAAGVHRVANATMQRAIRSVTIERGRDPRDFVLIAFGGSGPVHAAHLAQSLEVRRIVIPPFPGMFSALGLLVADVERLFMASHLCRLDDYDQATIDSAFAELERQARDAFQREGFVDQDLSLERLVDLRYRRQIHEMTIPFSPSMLETAQEALGEAFRREHKRTYGYAIDGEPVEIVTLKVRARGLGNWRSPPAWDRMATGKSALTGQRAAYFAGDEVDVPVLNRASLEGPPRPGPIIVEEYDSTVVVPPGWTTRRDQTGFIFLEYAP